MRAFISVQYLPVVSEVALHHLHVSCVLQTVQPLGQQSDRIKHERMLQDS